MITIAKKKNIEANNIPVMNDGFQEQSVAYQTAWKTLIDRTILTMLGAGNSYEEIQEVVSISAWQI